MFKNRIIAIGITLLMQQLSIAQSSSAATDKVLAQSIVPQGTHLIEHFSGSGSDATELAQFTCLQGTAATEKNTHWFRFKVSNPKQLLFAIAPLRLGDDLDFALFAQNELSESQEIRCSAQGRQLGNAYTPNEQCLGIIGLTDNATSHTAEKGCASVQHFLAPLSADPSLTYFLMVHNHSSEQGFTISFAQGKLLNSQSDVATDVSVGEVFPNPAQSEASLPITLPNATEGELLLLRANGQVVNRQSLSLVAGAQSLRIELPQEASELLYVRLLLNGKIFHRKVVTMR